MPSYLVIETGSGIANANSYVTVAEADTYFLIRNESAWAGTQAQKEAALIKGTQYIDGKYRSRWKGIRVSNLQTLTWPRVGVEVEDAAYNPWLSAFNYRASMGGYTSMLPDNYIPPELKASVCEAALRALSTTLAEDLRAGIASKNIAGAITTVYSQSSEQAVKVYQVIDQYLSTLLKSGNDIQRG